MVLRLSPAAALAALLLLLAAPAAAQVSGVVSGRVTERGTGLPVIGATVVIEGTNFGTAADADGAYRFSVTEGRYLLRFTALGYETVRDSIAVRRRETTELSVSMRAVGVEGREAVVEGQAEQGVGVSPIDPRLARDTPLPVADATRLVQTELGVTSSNELSNAFSVRGGSYDENQFFIDGFEIYRPLRISQGEQEGLGLINGDLTDRLTLFAGGFPVRYGGKLASVLDATYARPQGAFVGTSYASTLDAGAQVGGQLAPGVGLALAARSARPQRFFAGQELEGAYDPDFRDGQGVLDARLSARHTLRVDGLYARHRFRLAPQQRETTFGIFPNLVRTVAIDYRGEEVDGYDIAFGGALLTSQLGRVRAEHRLSVFRTDEFETLGVESRTSLFRRQSRPPGAAQADLDRLLEGTTAQRDTANNTIDQTVFTAQGRYLLAAGRRHGVELGWQARGLRFTDRIFEETSVTGRNAAGEAVTVPARAIDDTARLNTFQGALWVEDAVQAGRRLRLVPGLRADYFAYNSELTLSPRLNLLFRADTNTTWTAGVGVYHQAPTYRELRGDPAPGQTVSGLLDGDIASQRAVQAVVGLQRFFPSRRLGLRAEGYYKQLSNLISYDVENIRVDYSGDNDSRGFAGGFDVQLRGELVPGLESWVNYGFLVTRERFDAPERSAFGSDSAGTAQFGIAQAAFARRGGGDLVRRPTDRRHNLTFFVQDNVPGDDTWTLHIRTLYGTGIPSTAPAVSDVINSVTVFEPGPRNRQELPSYVRFDLGATKRLRVGTAVSGGPLTMAATVEVLNVFDQDNTVAQSYVEQSSRGRRTFLAVPTRLTPRTLNVRVRFDF